MRSSRSRRPEGPAVGEYIPKSVDVVRFIMDGGRLRDDPFAEANSFGVSRLGSVGWLGEAGASPSSERVVRPEKLISNGRRGVGRRRGGPSLDIVNVMVFIYARIVRDRKQLTDLLYVCSRAGQVCRLVLIDCRSGIVEFC